MATPAEIRVALAASLADIDGLQQSAYLLSNPTPPCAEIEPARTDYDLTMGRGTDRNMYTVRVYVAETTDIGAQKLLDTFMEPTGATSIKTALEADGTLGSLVDSVHVLSCSGLKSYKNATGGLYLGAEWTVEVIASN